MVNPIYLDYAATTPLDPGAMAAMLPWLSPGNAGNAQSRHHAYGRAALRAVEDARLKIAAAIRAKPGEIIFTSGATEGNNLVLQGVRAQLRATGRTHIITTAVEHKSVLGVLDHLAGDGFQVTILPVQPCGMVQAHMIERTLTPQTGLVCVQAVNNELGVIQPLAEIAAMLRGRDVLLHVDAAQALGKVPVDVAMMGADFMTLSAHKIHGPQGVGAVYIRSGCHLDAVHHGGAQEQGVRPGTVPVFLCAGFGAACALLSDTQLKDDRARLQKMRDDFIRHLHPLSPVIGGHHDPAWNVPGILNVRFPGIDHDTLLMALPGLAFGIGSACLAGPSHVMRAVTGTDSAGRDAIRISFGRFTTEDELTSAAAMMMHAVSALMNTRQEKIS